MPGTTTVFHYHHHNHHYLTFLDPLWWPKTDNQIYRISAVFCTLVVREPNWQDEKEGIKKKKMKKINDGWFSDECKAVELIPPLLLLLLSSLLQSEPDCLPAFSSFSAWQLITSSVFFALLSWHLAKRYDLPSISFTHFIQSSSAIFSFSVYVCVPFICHIALLFLPFILLLFLLFFSICIIWQSYSKLFLVLYFGW